MVHDTIAAVRAELAKPGVTKTGLAKRANLHPNTLRDADSEEWAPNARTLLALEAVLFGQPESAAA